MLKVNLSEKLKESQKQKKSLLGDFDPNSLLLEAHQKEQKIFDSLGFKSNSITTVHKNDIKRTAMAKSIYGKVSFMGKELKALCVDYDLKLLPTSYYNGDTPIEVARLVDEFCEKHSVLPTSHNFFILAPSEMFNNEKHIPLDMDPILFYREQGRNYFGVFAEESEIFTQIYNWGNDFSFMRKYRYLLSTYEGKRGDNHSNRWLFGLSTIILFIFLSISIASSTPITALFGLAFSYFFAKFIDENIFSDTWNINII